MTRFEIRFQGRAHDVCSLFETLPPMVFIKQNKSWSQCIRGHDENLISFDPERRNVQLGRRLCKSSVIGVRSSVFLDQLTNQATVVRFENRSRNFQWTTHRQYNCARESSGGHAWVKGYAIKQDMQRRYPIKGVIYKIRGWGSCVLFQESIKTRYSLWNVTDFRWPTFSWRNVTPYVVCCKKIENGS